MVLLFLDLSVCMISCLISEECVRVWAFPRSLDEILG